MLQDGGFGFHHSDQNCFSLDYWPCLCITNDDDDDAMYDWVGTSAPSLLIRLVHGNSREDAVKENECM